MITGISTNIPSPNIETLSVSGKPAPESSYIQLLVTKADLTTEQQLVYDTGVAVVAGKIITKIINTTAELNIDRMTSDIVEEGEDVFDFETLSEVDKDKLRNLLALFIELN
tara:strand:+ start:336 stop:668 length:333 start_codon:yes stop_codon:yes gene_type:complete